MKSHIKGIAASPGITIAKAYHLETPRFVIERKTVTDVRAEINRLNRALYISKQEIEKIKEETRGRLGEEHAEIFSAHLLMLEDPELIGQVKKKIKLENMNAEFALNEIKSLVINIFKNIDNHYMSERAVDFQDVIDRIMAHLLNVKFSNPSSIHEEVIMIADELSPSHTAQLNKEFVKGFVTDSGGYTSHSAIIARSLELPAVVGTKNITSLVRQDDLVIVDGNKGIIIINPTADEIQSYKEKQKSFEDKRKVWKKLKNEPTFTKDGYPIELFANINTPQDLNNVLYNSGEGIGLYRTEYLYMDQDDLPTEDEQFQAYQSVLMQMGEKPVIVRTLDVGGDKEIDYLNLPSEHNPFLGFRAIRFCLENEDIFRPQLRALIRASIYGNLKIMFPMITTLEEFRQARALFLDEVSKLEAEGTKVSKHIEIGMMVETPSTAIIAHQFAKEVDFFSIGTNDLIQYTMAADRMNEQVSYLYQPYHPAILSLVHNVIEAARAEGKWVCLCGEMAGDPIAVPILLALGLEKLSMSSASILPVRSLLRDLSREKLLSFKDKILSMGTTTEVIEFMEEHL